MRLAFMILLLVSVSACAVQPEKFQGPNGNAAYSMRCSGMGRDWADCYKMAATLCPSGYELIGQESGTIIVPSGSSVIGVPKQSMAVECK